MSGPEIACAVFLAMAMLSVVLSAVGILLTSDFFDRLHYMSPASTVGVCSIAIAVLIKESVNQAGIKAILIAVVVFFTSAVLAHATARAGYVEKYGGLKIRPEDRGRRPAG